MEDLLGTESEEELAAYLSQLRTWQEGSEGLWCSYHDPYADLCIISDTWPSFPVDQYGSRRPVMKRKVLRHRPDGTVEVSHESPKAKPRSLGHSRASVSDPISKREARRNTLENNLHYDDGNRSREDSLCSLLRDSGNNTASNYAMLRQARNYIAPKAPKVKRTDPVAKLKKYKQDWKRFCFPGQDPHESLRRAVHRQILQTGLPRREQKSVCIPNPYEVPTMKKRDSLRFGVRWDLAHRRIPRRNTTC